MKQDETIAGDSLVACQNENSKTTQSGHQRKFSQVASRCHGSSFCNHIVCFTHSSLRDAVIIDSCGHMVRSYDSLVSVNFQIHSSERRVSIQKVAWCILLCDRNCYHRRCVPSSLGAVWFTLSGVRGSRCRLCGSIVSTVSTNAFCTVSQ